MPVPNSCKSHIYCLMNPLSLRILSVNNFTGSITSKIVPFGNSYSTLTKIWSEKDCETTYLRWFSRAVIETTVTGIRSAGPFPSLFPRAYEWKDLLSKAFACRGIISAESFRKCISCLKCTNSVLPKRVTSVWHKMKKIILSRDFGSNCPVLHSRSMLLLSAVRGLCRTLSAVPGISEWEAAGIATDLSSRTDESHIKFAGIKDMLQIRI